MARIIKKELAAFLESKITHYADRMKTLPQRADRSALGELEFYMALRNVVSFPNNEDQVRYDQASLRDQGLLDAVNDTLIELGLVKHGEKFFESFWSN